ncbi:hypothetical protein KDL01_35815 [Actinospica durhamensis]|uniref:Uncharacterized protein n=1 Tax=Actinospica durhamensis TaxID=1508375 RepID=A0A941IW73_9ACTN|nr:hypothetical protein [Actinospica durhamensis]MBR7838691.1 hypothetical protein [Actinospica durhamensis]
MSRVERCYRQLIRLLPAEERAARGEELLGLLLDLEGDRHLPSVREAAGLLALTVRLHARRLGIGRLALGLFGAYLMVVGTTSGAQILAAILAPGAASSVEIFGFTGFVVALACLGSAAAWTLGAYRVTLMLFGLLAVYDIHALGATYLPGTGLGFFILTLGGIPGLLRDAIPVIGVPVLLGLAVKRQPARVPARFGLAGLVAALAVQTATFAGSSPVTAFGSEEFSRHYAAWILGGACAAAAAAHSRRRSPQVLLAATATAFAGGWIVSPAMPPSYATAMAAALCACEAVRAISTRRVSLRKAPAARA